MKKRAAVLLLLTATLCAPKMPENAPTAHTRGVSREQHTSRQRIDTYAASLAGSAAIDCGVGNDRTSDSRVYDCGKRVIELHRQFFCRYERWPSSHDDVITHEYEQGTVAYAYNRERTLFLVRQTDVDQFHALPAVQAGSSGPPSRMVRGARPPGLRSGTILIEGAHPVGIVIVELIVRPDGTIPDAQILKPSSPPINKLILDTLRERKCEPARLFGMPVALIYTIVVRVREDHLEFGIEGTKNTA